MSKYEEMSAVAVKGRKDFADYRQRSWQNFSRLVRGFIDYCGIPQDRIMYLRWNRLTGEDREYQEPRDGGRWALPGAVEFDEEDGYWHLGLCVTLTKPGTFPPMWFAFTLCISEQQGKLMVKTGLIEQPRTLDPLDTFDCAQLYEDIVDVVMARMKEPERRLEQRKKIGFDVPPLPSSGGEKETIKT
jgi:hypothetical protein